MKLSGLAVRSQKSASSQSAGAHHHDLPVAATAVTGELFIEDAERALLTQPQVAVPLVQMFAPGVYWRMVDMPAGSLIIGHRHKTEHFNVVMTGRALVSMHNEHGEVVTEEIVAPCVFVSKPGVRKVLLILEDMKWGTIHPTHETDEAKLEALLIEKSEGWLAHEEEVRALAQARAILQERKQPEA